MISADELQTTVFVFANMNGEIRIRSSNSLLNILLLPFNDYIAQLPHSASLEPERKKKQKRELPWKRIGVSDHFLMVD